MEFSQLFEEAWCIRERAHAPYSRFAVGAALLTREGKIFCGCNVENLSFGLTICAERAAVFSAVAAGETDFVAIAIVSDSKEPITPCGACRQVLAEFASDLEVRSATVDGTVFRSTLAELLPRPRAGILEG